MILEATEVRKDVAFALMARSGRALGLTVCAGCGERASGFLAAHDLRIIGHAGDCHCFKMSA